jgi:transcriptional regulator with XRE-family HTH domain
MQKWLADQVGCHPSEISDYCRGVHIPEEATRRAIATALALPVDDLFPSHEAAA